MSDGNETKRAIREGLLELMLNADADKISASELARSANVSRATFYHCYDSVDAVLREITEEFLEGMRDRHRYFIQTPIDFKRLDVPQGVFVSIAQYLLENKVADTTAVSAAFLPLCAIYKRDGGSAAPK